MIHPFLNDIGKMKVSEAIPVMELISADYNLDFAVLPANPTTKNKPLFIWRNNAFKIITRVLRNSQRNN